MTLDEALIIAKRMEDEEVVGTLGMAIRVLLKEYQEQANLQKISDLRFK